MEVMYLLIAFSLILAAGFLLAFIWAVRSGQYDDRDTPSIRMLIDDVIPEEKKKKGKKETCKTNKEELTDQESQTGKAHPPIEKSMERSSDMD